MVAAEAYGDLLEASVLEGMAARLAAENMTLAQVEQLSATAKALEAADHSQAQAWGVFEAGPDGDFHRQIAVGSRNLRLVQLLCDDLYPLLRFFRLRALPTYSTLPAASK